MEPLFEQSAFTPESLPGFGDEELPLVPYVIVAIALEPSQHPTSEGEAISRAREILVPATNLIDRRHEFWEREWSSSSGYHHMLHGGWGGHPNAPPEISRGRSSMGLARDQAAFAAKVLAAESNEREQLRGANDRFAMWLKLTQRLRLT